MTRPDRPTLEGERIAELHARQVRAVTEAVAKLPVHLRDAHGHEFTPEAVFEGAVKGAAVQLIAMTGCGAADVAALLADLAAAFEEGGDDAPARN